MGRVQNVESLEDLKRYGRKKPLEGISNFIIFVFWKGTLATERERLAGVRACAGRPVWRWNGHLGKRQLAVGKKEGKYNTF